MCLSDAQPEYALHLGGAAFFKHSNPLLCLRFAQKSSYLFVLQVPFLKESFSKIFI